MPEAEKVQKVLQLIAKRYANYEYFFNRLKSPDWIKPLQNEGFFRDPPPPKREGKYIMFPIWPESRYLARMASLAPQEVLEVILKIPDTENVRVHEDLVDAALAMPPELAAHLVEKAKQWARSPYQFLLPEKLGSLVAHLAKGGEVDKALELARVLLEPIPSTKTEVESEFLHPEPQARFDLWRYEQILKKDFPVLVQKAGIRAFDMLCDLLEKAICLMGREEPPEDYSYIWRPAIEDHEQNLHTLEDVLVSAVRDAAEQLAREDASRIPDLVQSLEARPWKVFHRIVLHLLRQFPNIALNLVTDRLTNRSLFDDLGVRHEYALLLKECFGMLPPNQQKLILDWIEAGPDPEQFKELTDEEAKRYRKIWQRNYLALIQSDLSPNWREFYNRLVAEVGEPEHPEFVSYIRTWMGPTSPKTAEELGKMSVDEIIQFLKSWQPPKEMFAPSPEGLGRVLSEVVAEDPERFSKEAEKFEGLNPTYVRALLVGLRKAVRNGRKFNWVPVLHLCQWVINQPCKNLGQDVSVLGADPNWGWTRKAVADLLYEGFNERTIPFKFRRCVWSILYPLTEDPDPTPEDEAKYGMDPVTLSINTTRGLAMHAVIQYALWVRHHIEKSSKSAKRKVRGFKEMPEVRKVLDEHLDTIKDPSLAIRTIYAQWFPFLVYLDCSWAKKQVNKIFPAEESERPFWDAAWGAYVSFNRPHDKIFEVLKQQYEIALERLEVAKERLAEHLMVLYWQGRISISDPLFKKFWDKAPETLRGYALEFIGRSLYNSGRVPKKTLNRLIVLWENRLNEAKHQPDKHKTEMTAFGWWFASGKFDDLWAIEQILEALKITGKVMADHLVVQRLAEMAPCLPLQAINVLATMVRGDKEGWGILVWREEARKVLKTALASTDQEANKRARELINELLAEGFLEFRDLLESTE